MRQANHKFSTSTRGKGLYNITREITSWVTRQKVNTGLLTIFIPHTSASIVIQEMQTPMCCAILTNIFRGWFQKATQITFTVLKDLMTCLLIFVRPSHKPRYPFLLTRETLLWVPGRIYIYLNTGISHTRA